MALQNIPGSGLWLPADLRGFPQVADTASDAGLLDADEEEFQVIGTVTIDGGGSKTFGTSGSGITWLPGASITFGVVSTLRVGVKQASSIDTANGPPARATIGAAAFDVYKDLVAGVDTITSLTAQTTAMASGTPFTVTDGDMIAICFHLDITSGSQSIKIRQGSGGAVMDGPVMTLVTTGPTYTAQATLPNLILTFDDGSIGWIEPTRAFSVGETSTSAIGNTNIIGNVFRVPFSCKVDTLAAYALAAAGGNFELNLYSDPLGTPAVMGAAIVVDANTLGIASTNRWLVRRLATPQTLSINTDYAVGVRQTTATSVASIQRDVLVASHFKAGGGLGSTMYAANSTAGGAFAQQASGLRQYGMAVRISALDDGVGGGGGGASQLINSGALVG